jgi:hypothetical protein
LLHFVLVEHVAVGGLAQGAVRPDQVVDAVDALNVHGQTLETVGDLAGDRLALEAANLLEVGELGHFHAVQPHFSPDPRHPASGFPVVFHEADVVDLGIHAQLFQGAQIEFLNVVGKA